MADNDDSGSIVGTIIVAGAVTFGVLYLLGCENEERQISQQNSNEDEETEEKEQFCEYCGASSRNVIIKKCKGCGSLICKKCRWDNSWAVCNICW